MPKKVFISYRREDTAAAAGRVYDRLVALLSKPNVFFDVSTIGGGEDFAQRIASEIANSDAALVFIGDKWLEQSCAGRTARASSSPTTMCAPSCARRCRAQSSSCRCSWAAPICPRPSNCPRTSEPSPPRMPCRFATRVSTTIRRISWPRCWALRRGSGRGRTRHRSAPRSPTPSAARQLLSLLVLLVALLHFWLMGRPLSASIGAPLTTMILGAAALAGAWIGWRYKAGKPALR